MAFIYIVAQHYLRILRIGEYKDSGVISWEITPASIRRL